MLSKILISFDIFMQNCYIIYVVAFAAETPRARMRAAG